MEDGTDFCCFAFCEFISSPRENPWSETFVTGGKQKDRTVPIFLSSSLESCTMEQSCHEVMKLQKLF